MRVRTALGALEERPFRLLWLGQTLSAAGDALVPIAIAFAVLELGNAHDLGFVMACYVLPRALLTLAGGVWADRLPRRLVMIGSDLVRAGAQATAALLLISGSAEIWQLAATSAARRRRLGVLPACVERARPGDDQRARGCRTRTRSWASRATPSR